jgi:hypothetical protein
MLAKSLQQVIVCVSAFDITTLSCNLTRNKETELEITFKQIWLLRDLPSTLNWKQVLTQINHTDWMKTTQAQQQAE